MSESGKQSQQLSAYPTNKPEISKEAVEQEEMNESPEHERFASESEEPEVQEAEPLETEGDINVTIAVEVARCDECGAYAEIGSESCPGCGEVVDVDWQEKAHLYKARREVFGELAEVLQHPIESAGVVPVTEWQYLRFVNESHVLSAEPSERMRRTINSLDLSEPSAIRSSETRYSAKILCQDAHKIRRLIAELKSLRPYGVFSEPHKHLVSTFEAYREYFRELADALLSRGPSEVENHQRAAQPHIDLASNEIRAFSKMFNELREAYPDGLAEDTVEERLASFLIGSADVEIDEITDLAQLGLGSFDAFMAPRDDGYRYFSDMLTTPLEELSEGMPQVLYLLALMVGSQDDPAGVLHRASMFVDVVNEALTKDRGAMLTAAVDMQKDLNEAAGILTSLTPQVEAILGSSGMTEEALKDFAIRVYGRLTEGCFRRVVNLLVFAIFISKDSPRSWEDIADWSSFGEKYQWLSDAARDETAQPAFSSALEGVEKIVRNSDAHTEFELLEDGIRFIQTNFSKRKKTEKVFSDEEFASLIVELLRTLMSLSVAGQMFQCDNMDEIGSDLAEQPTPEALRPLYLELFLAVTGLTEPEVDEEGGGVTVSASVPEYQVPGSLYDYVKNLFFIAFLYPEAEGFTLNVRYLGEPHSNLTVPSASMLALKGAPEHLEFPRALGLLLSAQASSVTLSERTDEEKLKDLGFGAGCAILYDHLTHNMQLIERDGMEAVPELQRSLEILNAFKKVLLALEAVDPEVKTTRTELISAVDDVAHLYKTMVRVSRGVIDQSAVSRGTKRYGRGVSKIEELTRTFSFSGRLL